MYILYAYTICKIKLHNDRLSSVKFMLIIWNLKIFEVHKYFRLL